jgi:hypothetical protein
MPATYTTWGDVQRPWGYEVRVDIRFEDGTVDTTFVVFPEGKPTQAALATRINAFVRQRDAAYKATDNKAPLRERKAELELELTELTRKLEA